MHCSCATLLLFLQFLEDQGLYESVDESSLREEVLGTLDKLVKDWVKKVGRAAELADNFVAESNAKIFTFGSYRLGVHGPGEALSTSPVGLPIGTLKACNPADQPSLLVGADIDTLCVGPRHVSRENDFFGSEAHCLQSMLMVTLIPTSPQLVAVCSNFLLAC